VVSLVANHNTYIYVYTHLLVEIKMENKNTQTRQEEKDIHCRGCGATGLFEKIAEKTTTGEQIFQCECGHEEVR